MTGFRGSKIVSDSLVLVFMTPTKVKMNKPLHIGATILEHSKRVGVNAVFGVNPEVWS